MPYEIKASKIVRKRFPPEEGAELAKALLSRDLDWDDLTVDLKGLPASLLISAFFNGFLAIITAERPELLPKAKRICWQLDYDFQSANVARWMKGFVEIH